jgi:tartrate dehydrogenase/decarboxylase/D-malate dehydrogenase
MPKHKIALIEGDGIGKEVVPEGRRVVDAAARLYGTEIQWQDFDWGSDYYKRHGRMMPVDGLAQIASHDAIFLGAIGWPTVPDHVSLWSLLLPIRREFQQYINLRPVRGFDGLSCPLATRRSQDIDFVIVRENSEGEYSDIGGRFRTDSDQEVVVQESIFTRTGVDRVMRFAFELARKRDRQQLTSATKSNGIFHTMPFWDERFRAIAQQYPEIHIDQYHIDILTAHLVRDPERFDVIVATNLFGDILSDLGAAVAGTIGIAPSANLNPGRRFPSMFEPVHGSAPDIAGRNVANPIGQVWSGAMMLEHLGHQEAAAAIIDAIARVLADGGPRTPDMGGTASTQAVGQAIVDAL